MQFGVYLNTQTSPGAPSLRQVYDELLETAETAEALGFDWCFLPEHHQQPDGYLPAPFVMAGAIAARTSRIGIATGIHLLPLWHPMRVAEDVAVLNILSSGRFMLGVGLGLVADEFRQFDIDLPTAAQRLEEQIAILRQAWSPKPVEFAGRHFRVSGVDVTPKPEFGSVPVVIGGMSDAAVRRAGRLADGWLTDPLHSITSLERWSHLYRAASDAADRPASIWLQRDCWVADSTESVVADWAPWLVEDWRFYFSLGLFSSGRFNPAAESWIKDVRSSDDISYDLLSKDRVLAGTPADVTGQLSSAVDRLAPRGVALRFRYPGGPGHEQTLTALRLFATEVMPRFR
jgi:alkanesulfonate monooxygenase SsuD/methylene tetrahydromethanopterin reductase-like flavin-dependent oxidoreductase (luciferase family)